MRGRGGLVSVCVCVPAIRPPFAMLCTSQPSMQQCSLLVADPCPVRLSLLTKTCAQPEVSTPSLPAFPPFSPLVMPRAAASQGSGALVRLSSVQEAQQAIAALHNQRLPGSIGPLVVRYADSAEQKAKKAARMGRAFDRFACPAGPMSGGGGGRGGGGGPEWPRQYGGGGYSDAGYGMGGGYASGGYGGGYNGGYGGYGGGGYGGGPRGPGAHSGGDLRSMGSMGSDYGMGGEGYHGGGGGSGMRVDRESSIYIKYLPETVRASV